MMLCSFAFYVSAAGGEPLPGVPVLRGELLPILRGESSIKYSVLLPTTELGLRNHATNVL